MYMYIICQTDTSACVYTRERAHIISAINSTMQKSTATGATSHCIKYMYINHTIHVHILCVYIDQALLTCELNDHACLQMHVHVHVYTMCLVSFYNSEIIVISYNAYTCNMWGWIWVLYIV